MDTIANISSICFLIYLIRQVSVMIVVMEKQSRFIYSNDYTTKLFGYRSEESMLGDNADDIHFSVVTRAPEFLKQDEYVRTKQQALTMLDIHSYANGENKMFIANKVPFLMHGTLVGTVNLHYFDQYHSNTQIRTDQYRLTNFVG